MKPKKTSSNLTIVLLLIIFFPVGLLFMWLRSTWKMSLKIIVSILFLFAVIYASTSGSSSGVSNEVKSPIMPTHPIKSESAIKITAVDLLQAYDENKLAAEDKYKGKIIQTDGYIENISYDITGKTFLLLSPSHDLSDGNIQCFFDNRKDVLKLKKGEDVQISGKVSNMTFGILTINSCKL